MKRLRIPLDRNGLNIMRRKRAETPGLWIEAMGTSKSGGNGSQDGDLFLAPASIVAYTVSPFVSAPASLPSSSVVLCLDRDKPNGSYSIAIPSGSDRTYVSLFISAPAVSMLIFENVNSSYKQSENLQAQSSIISTHLSYSLQMIDYDACSLNSVQALLGEHTEYGPASSLVRVGVRASDSIMSNGSPLRTSRVVRFGTRRLRRSAFLRDT